MTVIRELRVETDVSRWFQECWVVALTRLRMSIPRQPREATPSNTEVTRHPHSVLVFPMLSR